MNNKSVSKPAISFDLKRNRIRIYKRTLRSIGDPEYIHLLVNPEELTLAILRSERSDQRAYHIPRVRFENRPCIEIASKSLMRNLLNMCSKWQDNCLYRVYGEIEHKDGIVKFNLADSFVACGTRG